MNLHSLPRPLGSKCQARNRFGRQCCRITNHGPESKTGRERGTDHWCRPGYGSNWRWAP